MDKEHVEQLIRNLSHEIKNPLTTIKGYLQLAQMKRSDPEFFDKSISVMISQVDRIEKILDALYPVFSVRDFDNSDIDLHLFINESLTQMGSAVQHVTSSVPAGTHITSDPDILFRIIHAIVAAFDWEHHSDVSCSISLERKDDRSYLRIEFSGTDFPQSPGKSSFVPYGSKVFYPGGIELYEAFWLCMILGCTIEHGGHDGIFLIGLP